MRSLTGIRSERCNAHDRRVGSCLSAVDGPGRGCCVSYLLGGAELRASLHDVAVAITAGPKDAAGGCGAVECWTVTCHAGDCHATLTVPDSSAATRPTFIPL